MSVQDPRIYEIRKRVGERQNHIIDEYIAARISRREFIRRATIIGMSFPTVSFLAATLGDRAASGAPSPGSSAAARGGALYVGTTKPARALDPLTIGDTGAGVLVGQTAEYLALSTGEPELRPVLAESWEPNDNASVWTFKIRQGVTFHDGRRMTARDVAASFNFASDPQNGSNSLEAWEGILSPGGCTATDDATVVMELDKPVGSWPWLASNDNSSAVILPEGFSGRWEETWVGTGPWQLGSYTPGVRATLVRNEDYWSPKTIADRIEFTLYEDQVAMVLGLLSGDVQAISSFGVATGRAIVDNPDRFKTIVTPSSAHWPLTMQVNDPSLPTSDKRVRQAMALVIDRQLLVDELLRGYGDVGNDSPFAPIHAAYPADVAQRTQDLERAKQLLTEAGFADGFTIPVSVWDTASNAQYAQILQDAARQVGIQLELTLMDSATFLGTGEFGSSPQLDSVATINDWGHRGIPNVFLGAQLRSDGVRNASHWHNDQFDQLVDQFFAEPDLQRQRQLAAQIQELLHDETPMVYAFFGSDLTATTLEVDDVVSTPSSLMLFDQATGARA